MPVNADLRWRIVVIYPPLTAPQSEDSFCSEICANLRASILPYSDLSKRRYSHNSIMANRQLLPISNPKPF